MLICCPECKLQLSDKALSCPHCGYPMKPQARKSTHKRKRLPNGFGQITKLKGANLRKPYRAMVTVAKTAEGKPVQKLLRPSSYFETYNDAYAALLEYNRSPYDLDSEITVKELFDKWIVFYETKHPDCRFRSNFLYCEPLYNVQARNIRARHIKGLLEAARRLDGDAVKEASPNTKASIKSLFNLMFDWAVEYELVDKNYARDFGIGDILEDRKAGQKPHVAFTDEEINVLWANVSDPWVKIILINIYSGWRPDELMRLELTNVDLDKNIMIGGLKTKNGIDRPVPIHSKIKSLVEEQYRIAERANSKYLLVPPMKTKASAITYFNYRYNFLKVIKELGLNDEHLPHDARKTFVTLAKRYKVDEYAIKYIVGHSIRDLTERVYTERDWTWLKEEIEKIR